jgi:radical SAM superfamily enzyme YgiQ (UPF0313 family)
MSKDVVILFFPNPVPGDSTQYRVPYALLYLERALRETGLEVLLVDEQLEPDWPRILAEKRDRLLLAGVSSLTGEQIEGGIAFSKAVRESCDASIAWGGWHATLLPEETLAEPYIDFVVIGQGERPLRQLAEGLRDGKSVADIRGLAYKQGGSVAVNRPAPSENINVFPRINLGRLDLNRYLNRSRLPERFIGYFASHGCPLDCAFCCVAEIYNRRWYHKPVGEVIEDLQFLKDRAQIDSVHFEDDNFFVHPQFSLELAQSMIEAKLNLKWETSAHAGMFIKAFHDEDVRLFSRSGCRQVYVGAESGDQRILNMLDKHTEVEDNLRFVALLKPHGITPRFSTIVCFPTDTNDDLDLTIDMIRRAKLADRHLRASVFFYTPYPGTRLYELAKERGFGPPQRLEGWARHTLRRFRAPWAAKGIKWRLEVFANFYLPLADPQFYRLVRSKKLRAIVFLINKLFYPIARLRLRLNWFRCPVEAYAFLTLLHVYNVLTDSAFCLGNESYLQ